MIDPLDPREYRSLKAIEKWRSNSMAFFSKNSIFMSFVNDCDCWYFVKIFVEDCLERCRDWGIRVRGKGGEYFLWKRKPFFQS